MPRTKYYPSLRSYTVLRMDPVATVASVRGADKEALDAARAIQPKTYLIYINQDIALPHPNKPCFCYSVMPVAPCLRPADLARHIEPGMCVPIAPNENHPDGRDPVRPERPFPFANCYHWDSTALTVRVRAAPAGWDSDAATSLPVSEHNELRSHFDADHLAASGWPTARMLNFDWDAPLPADMLPFPGQADPGPFLPLPPPGVIPHPLAIRGNNVFSSDVQFVHQTGVPPAPAGPAVTTSGTSRSAATSEAGDADADADAGAESDRPTSASSANTSVDSFAESMHALESITAIGDLREKAKDAELLPVVDLWYDLTAHLTQADIPSPLDFFRERHEIVKIVRAARRRAAARPPTPPAPIGSAHSLAVAPAESESDHAEEQPEPPRTKPRRLRPVKNLRRLRKRVGDLLDSAARPIRSRFSF